MQRHRRFLLWQLCPGESWAWRWCSCLASGDPGGPKCAGTWTASATGLTALSESFLEPLVAGDQQASDQSFSVAPPGQALRGLPCLEPSTVVWSIRHIKGAPLAGVLLCRLAHQTLKGVPWVGPYSVFWSINHWKEHRGWGEVLLCSSMHQAFDRPASLLFSCRCWRVGRGRLWWWLHPLCMTQQYRLVSMVAQLSSTGISHHNLLPHTSSVCLSAVNNSPRPEVVPQPLKSSSQPLCLPGDLYPSPGYVWLWQGLSDSHFI